MRWFIGAITPTVVFNFCSVGSQRFRPKILPALWNNLSIEEIKNTNVKGYHGKIIYHNMSLKWKGLMVAVLHIYIGPSQK